MTADRGGGPLALRLAAAFLGVAITAIAVMATLIVVAASRETTELIHRQHVEAARTTAGAAGAAYRDARGWNGADLGAAATVAAGARARLVVTDRSGVVVAAPTDQLARMMAAMHGVATVDQPRGHPVGAPVVVDGTEVGHVALTFPLGEGGSAEQVRDALWRTAVIGAALAAAAALGVALFVAGRLTRPLTALTAAASRLAAGDRTARAGVVAPGELGTLAAAFDDMAERLETEDHLRRKLVTDVAHELRTPLTILQGETEALVDGISAFDAEAARSLHDEATRLSRLVEDLETLAAADAARLSLDVRPVDLADIAARTIASVRTTAAEAGVTLEQALAPTPAVGDADRLQQVVLNLLSNAIKFTPPGGTITVRTVVAGGRCRLEVADTGPGLDEGESAHVFERFWRGSAGRAGPGSGIGLAVASELAAAHGGGLTATSAEDAGAVFTLELPTGP